MCASGRAEDGLGNRLYALAPRRARSSRVPPDGTAPSRPEAATRSDGGDARGRPADRACDNKSTTKGIAVLVQAQAGTPDRGTRIACFRSRVILLCIRCKSA